MVYRILIWKEREGQWVEELDHRQFICLMDVQQAVTQLKLEQNIRDAKVLVEELAH